MSEEIYVYGAFCTFNGPISKASKTRDEFEIPCCPYCGSVLYQVENEDEWKVMVEKHEQKGHKNYARFISWMTLLPICVPLQGGLEVLRQRYNWSNPDYQLNLEFTKP